MKTTALALLLLISTAAFATGDDDHGCPPGHEHLGSCDNTGPPGPEGPPGPQGEQGPPGADGADGRDGIDGQDGQDGRDGIDGIDGINGIAGKDGVVDYTRVNKTIHQNFSRWRHYLAASTAIQIHLPQDSSQRFTLSGSSVDGTSGVGAGYAYKFDREDNLSISAGIGSSGGETLGVLSVGFEFGGNRTSDRYDSTEVALQTLQREALAMQRESQRKFDENVKVIEELRLQLQRHEAETNAVEEFCKESNKRVHEACVRK